jgi:hypothetical protein
MTYTFGVMPLTFEPLTADQCIHFGFVAKLGTFFHAYAASGWPWGGTLTTEAA